MAQMHLTNAGDYGVGQINAEQSNVCEATQRRQRGDLCDPRSAKPLLDGSVQSDFGAQMSETVATRHTSNLE